MHRSLLFETVTVTLSLIDAAIAQIPPNFSPSASVQLQVAYGKTLTVIQPGQTVPFKETTQTPPTIGLIEPPESSGPYLLTMIDPDAPTPQHPTLSQLAHWIQSDMILEKPMGTEPDIFPYVLTSPEDPIASFIPPSPPPGSPPHRYIQLLWIQPEDFALPPAFADLSGSNRTLFNVAAFAKAARLRGPIAANYWLTSRDFTKGGTTVGSMAPSSTTKSSGSSSVVVTSTRSTASVTPVEPKSSTSMTTTASTRSATPVQSTGGMKPTGSTSPTSHSAAASAQMTHATFGVCAVAFMFSVLL